MPSSLTKIEDNAFKGCDSLTLYCDYTLGNGVTITYGMEGGTSTKVKAYYKGSWKYIDGKPTSIK